MTAEYDRGYADGASSRDAEVDALQRAADYWYFRANNPKSEWPEVKMVNSIIDGMEANEERAKKFAELDRIEQEKFDAARALFTEDLTDMQIACRVGLFVPIVANLRAGVL